MKKLILVRGLPGSGKTTKARELMSQTPGLVYHFEADQFFVRDSVYQWDENSLYDAHFWCRHSTRRAIADSHDCTVIVSNTFTTFKEIKPYFTYMLSPNDHLSVEIIHVHGNYGSIHDVPLSSYDRMMARLQTNEQVQALLVEHIEQTPFLSYINMNDVRFFDINKEN